MRAGYTEDEWKKLEHTQTAQANTLAEGGPPLPAVAQGKARGDRVASYHPTWTLRIHAMSPSTTAAGRPGANVGIAVAGT